MSNTKTSDPRLTPLTASLPDTVPFVGPETKERVSGKPFAARLGANENVLGPSPLAIKAMQDAAKDVWMYGDPENHDLRHALADHHGVSSAEIVVGAGIDGLLDSLVRLTVTLGDSVVTSRGAYPTFNYHVTGYGGTVHTIGYTADYEDPDHLVAKAREVGAKLVYLANPDNPMGTYHTATTLQQMIRSLPDDCLLVLDEAYIELAPADAAPLMNTSESRVIRLRTFSKAYGMAGARVGYAIGPKPLISAFNRVRNHFDISRISQAGALAALADQSWLNEVQDKTETARNRLYNIALDNGLKPIPSSTNFVTIDCGADGTFASGVLEALIAEGIFVRMPSVAPLDRCIRISCGTPDQLNLVAEALPKALTAAKDAQKL